MKKPTAPCKACEERKVGCKSTCIAWKIHEQKWKKYTELVKEQKARSNVIAIGKDEILHLRIIKDKRETNTYFRERFIIRRYGRLEIMTA